MNAILNAVHQNMAEHRGIFVCSGATKELSTSTTTIKDGGGSGDIATCIIPDYISSMPFDPATTTAHFTSMSDYNSGYDIFKDGNGRITVNAVGELTPIISVTR